MQHIKRSGNIQRVLGSGLIEYDQGDTWVLPWYCGHNARIKLKCAPA